jgi:mono/diheme cytochrome c family protein
MDNLLPASGTGSSVTGVPSNQRGLKNMDMLPPRPLTRLVILALGVCLAASSSAAPAKAASLSQQRRDLNKAATALRTASRLQTAGRSKEAAEAFEAAQKQLETLATDLDPRLRNQFDRTIETLGTTHAELSGAGVKVPALATITVTESTGSPDLGLRGSAPRGDQISFTDAVAPLLVSKCGGCHVDRAQGGFSMSNYNALMRGTRGGKVIEVGSGAESLLVDVIASGSMPPNGNTVSPEETQVLLRWINQGAKFDGDDPDKSLRDLKRGSGQPTVPDASPAPAPAPKPNIRKPKGDETVSFSLDIAPLLTASCVECHGGNNPSAMFSTASFEQFWKGGNGGAAIVPGKPAESLLVQKLKGMAPEGGQMPLNRPAWSADKIALVEKWISEGASFDGPNPTDSLSRITAVVKASRATSDELNDMRRDESLRRWRLALPDEPAEQFATDRFLIIGNLPPQQLEELGKQAEEEADRVLKFFARTGKPLNKSRITLMVFPNRIDYGEFATMVERRDLGGNEGCHAVFDLVHPYGALIVATNAEAPPGRALAQMIGELYVAAESQGRFPEWLTAGSGRAVAARLWPKDPIVDGWNSRLPAAVTSLSSPDAFMSGKVPPATADVAGYSFANTVLQKPGNLLKWAELVAQGQSFERGAEMVFKRNLKELAELWAASVSRRR